MRISLSSILVDDQEAALEFYTGVLGFRKKEDIPMGEFRWLTVVSEEAPEGPELVLEPNANPAAKTYQQALFEQGIPLTAFRVDDIQEVFENLTRKGVAFRVEPMDAGTAKIAIFEDTCGNLVQIYQA